MTRATSLFILFLVVALAGTSPAYGSELAAWDQEKVTAIAGDLSRVATELRDAVRAEPVPSFLDPPGRQSFFNLKEDVHLLASAARRLHQALGEGAGLDETYPTYQRLLAAARRGHRELRWSGLGEPVSGKIEATAAAIRRMRPFYEAEPPL